MPPRHVRVLTLLPDDSAASLRNALAHGHALTPVADAGTLAATALAGGADAVALDPSLVDDADWVRLRPVLASPHVPVLLYARLTSASVKRIVTASAVGVHEVLLFGHDDDPASIRERLSRLRTPAPPARVMAFIADRIARLPPGLQSVTVPLFCAGPVPRWADDVAQLAGLPRRSVDRWMGRAGLAATASLLDVARLARVWVPLVVDEVDPADVALRAGFLRARTLAVHTRRIVGASPTHFGVRLSEDEFVERLTQHAVRA